ncbi:MAG TPA: YchJ family protein [Moraxellaceae bacterium]
MTLCHCGSGSELNACCAPIIARQIPAPTAESLMRARYSAYVSRDIDFVMSSTLPASRSDSDLEAMRSWSEQAEWESLEIVSRRKGSESDNEGEVEFIARYRLQGVGQQHHERSEFVRVDGEWFFKDGHVLASGPTEKAMPVVNASKTGRNDPCPCGSGKKFKKCCGA